MKSIYVIIKSSNVSYIMLRPIRSADSTEGAFEEVGRAEQHIIIEAAPKELKVGREGCVK